jgi:hypothetical protein
MRSFREITNFSAMAAAIPALVACSYSARYWQPCTLHSVLHAQKPQSSTPPKP